MRGDRRRNGLLMMRALAIVLRPAPLLTILAMAAVLRAAFKTAPFGLALGFMVLSWNARHSIALLHALGAGGRRVPVLSLEMILGTLQGWRSFLAMLALVGLLFATGAAAYWIGPLLALVAAALAAAVLPVALLILGWTNNIAQAIQLSTWLRLARTLGADLLQLEVAGIALAGLVVLLSGTLHAHPILGIASMLLGWLLLVALAGVTMHARRADLSMVMPFHAGIELAPSPEELARRRQESIDAVYAQWRNGARTDAWRTVEQLAAAAQSRAQELRRIYRHSLVWDAAALSARIAQELIALDLREARPGYALRLARERLAADRQFRPATAGETLQLATLALQYADPDMAETLLEGFDRFTMDEPLLAASRQLRATLHATSAR